MIDTLFFPRLNRARGCVSPAEICGRLCHAFQQLTYVSKLLILEPWRREGG